jgi:hypothetical protein
MSKANTTYIPDINGWISYYEKQAGALVSDEKPVMSCASLMQKSQKDTGIIGTDKPNQQHEGTEEEAEETEEEEGVEQEQHHAQNLHRVAYDIAHVRPALERTDLDMAGEMKFVSAVQSAVEQAKGIKKMKSSVKRNNVVPGGGHTKKKQKKKVTKQGKKRKEKRDIFNP